MSDKVLKKKYPNGLTVVFQRSPHSVSVSVGVWLNVGSVYENDSEKGYSHFLEHMLFKGTKKRTSIQQAEEIERVGGYINGFTSREYTYYNINVVKSETEIAMDILSDMVFYPLLKEKDIKNEKNVIIEEMRSYEDSPDDYVYDDYFKNFFKGHAVGLNIVGTEDSVKSVNSKKLQSFYKKYYSPHNILLAISSSHNFSELEPLIEKYFASEESRPYQKTPLETQIEKSFSTNFIQRKLGQVNFLIGAQGFERSFDVQVKLNLFTNIFGGGMSSRLFQRIREKLGLCYSISCFPSTYTNTGIVTISCATSTEPFLKCFHAILAEIKKLKKKGFTQKELDDAKSHQIGSMAIGFETPDHKMVNTALQEIYYGKYYTLKDRVNAIQKVTLDDLNELTEKIFSVPKLHFTGIGEFDPKVMEQVIPSIE